jgi:hypothetical protein
LSNFEQTPKAEEGTFALFPEEGHKTGKILIVDGKYLRENESAAHSQPETALERFRPAR